MFRAVVGLALAVGSGMPTGLSVPAQAQENAWVDAVFPEHSHNFGTVARGSKVKHSFRLVNNTNHNIHITNWSTKCGCTDVKVGARDIPPGTQTFVEATLDTTKFLGPKNSGLTLFFDRPGFAQKDLSLSCYIRGDVLLNPGSIDFGVVTRGTPVTQILQLSYYGGQPNWGITKIDTISPAVTAKAEEIEGTRTGGSVQYRLTVQLNPTAPVGYLKEEVTLHTNDTSSDSIPISVTANIQGTVVATPSVLTLGNVRAGQSIAKDVLVRSAKPFTLVEAAAREGEISASELGQEARTLHKITLTMKMPEKAGPFYGLVELKTSVPDEPPIKVSAFATVVP